jgi:hypothetical protein
LVSAFADNASTKCGLPLGANQKGAHCWLRRDNAAESGYFRIAQLCGDVVTIHQYHTARYHQFQAFQTTRQCLCIVEQAVAVAYKGYRSVHCTRV